MIHRKDLCPLQNAVWNTAEIELRIKKEINSKKYKDILFAKNKSLYEKYIDLKHIIQYENIENERINKLMATNEQIFEEIEDDKDIQMKSSTENKYYYNRKLRIYYQQAIIALEEILI